MENLKQRKAARATQPTALCDNCESRFTANKLLPIKDVFDRVAPGEPMPLGECPNCGALCHAVEAGRTYNGLHIKYSPVNQAYFLMWHVHILRVFQTKAEAKAEMDYLLRSSNPSGRTYEVAGKSFTSRAKAEKYAKQIGKTGIRVPVYETTGA